MENENKKSKWTRFMDMHSGGRSKEEYEYILIEAPLEEAKIIFYNRFGHNPSRVTCTCCGEDYSIDESESLEEATGYDRNCRFGYVDKDGNEVPEEKAWISGKGIVPPAVKSTYFEEDNKKEIERCKSYGGDFYKTKYWISIEEYANRKDVLIIYSEDIKEEERKGELPKQGYVWID